TNVLSLDTLRALGLGRASDQAVSQVGMSQGQVGISQGQEGGLAPALIRTGSGSDRVGDGSVANWIASEADAFQAFKAAVTNCLQPARNSRLTDAVLIARSALDHAENWLGQAKDQTALESVARRCAMTLGRRMELALLVKHAQW